MKVEFEFENGIEVKDRVSGFTGIIECQSMWLNGCRRYSVQPKIKKGEVTMPASMWIDEESLEKLGDGVSKEINAIPTGGPSFSSEGARG